MKIWNRNSILRECNKREIVQGRQIEIRRDFRRGKMKLWQEAAVWLSEIQVLPEDHLAVIAAIDNDEKGLETLSLTLRDGVILCKVAEKFAKKFDARKVHLR